MRWLSKIADQVELLHPEGDLIVSSGVSPSGKYHVGTLREVLTADAVLLVLQARGRHVRHIHFVDDLDGLRKVPAGVPESFSQYLGKPVCDVPSPEAGADSYADFYLSDFVNNIELLGIRMQVERSHLKYRAGYFVPSIEKALAHVDTLKACLTEVSGRQLDPEWSPIQVYQNGYLKKRPFVSINTAAKTLVYRDVDGEEQTISYAHGEVKLDWRIDWPARWWQLGVDVEPFGRDHASKGGSYDTGKAIVERAFGGQAPLPVPYEFINRAGETKKMSKSAGNTVTISELLEVLPPEIVRYFVLRYGPDKTLYFDQAEGIAKLVDDYAELLAKTAKTDEDRLLIEVCQGTVAQKSISNIPFLHLVVSYQAGLHDVDKALTIIGMPKEYAAIATEQTETIKRQLGYVHNWLEKWAPDSVKFSLLQNLQGIESLSEPQKQLLVKLGDKIATAPADADGEWFHNAVYAVKEESDLEPSQVFGAIYQALIGKAAGPRAGYFLSVLDRDWLVKRLHLDA